MQIKILLLASFILLASNNAAEKNIATRKVSKPSGRQIYASARKLEIKGDENSIEDAMSIYRMAIHNGARGNAKEQAYLGLARCEYQKKNYWRSFQAIEESFPQKFVQKEIDHRVMMELDLAKRMAMLGSRELEDAPSVGGKKLSGVDGAAAVFEAANYNDPKGKHAAYALWMRGRCLKSAGRYKEAELAYRLLTNTYPRSKEAALAQPELAVAMVKNEKGGYELEGEKELQVTEILNQAKTIRGGKEFAGNVDEAVAIVNEKKAAKMLESAQFYLSRGSKESLPSARFLLGDIIKRFPQTESAGVAEKLLNKLDGKNGASK